MKKIYIFPLSARKDLNIDKILLKIIQKQTV